MYRRKPNILVVDDVSDDRVMTRIILEKNNCDVVEASSFEEVLEELNRDYLDLIVLDIQMPDINCTEALDKIKLYNHNKRYGLGKEDVSVILYTSSYVALAEQKKYESKGATSIVMKDKHPTVLVDKIKELLLIS